MDVEFGHEIAACEGSDAVEGAEGARDDSAFCEVGAVDEDLGGGCVRDWGSRLVGEQG